HEVRPEWKVWVAGSFPLFCGTQGRGSTGDALECASPLALSLGYVLRASWRGPRNPKRQRTGALQKAPGRLFLPRIAHCGGAGVGSDYAVLGNDLAQPPAQTTRVLPPKSGEAFYRPGNLRQ